MSSKWDAADEDIAALCQRLNRPEEEQIFWKDVKETNPQLFPRYEAICPTRTCLEQMYNDALKGLYRSEEGWLRLKNDIELIQNNCLKFNGEDGYFNVKARNWYAFAISEIEKVRRQKASQGGKGGGVVSRIGKGKGTSSAECSATGLGKKRARGYPLEDIKFEPQDIKTEPQDELQQCQPVSQPTPTKKHTLISMKKKAAMPAVVSVRKPKHQIPLEIPVNIRELIIVNHFYRGQKRCHFAALNKKEAEEEEEEKEKEKEDGNGGKDDNTKGHAEKRKTESSTKSKMITVRDMVAQFLGHRWGKKSSPEEKEEAEPVEVIDDDEHDGEKNRGVHVQTTTKKKGGSTKKSSTVAVEKSGKKEQVESNSTTTSVDFSVLLNNEFRKAEQKRYMNLVEQLLEQFDCVFPHWLLYEQERSDALLFAAKFVSVEDPEGRSIPWHRLVGVEYWIRFLLHFPQIGFILADRAYRQPPTSAEGPGAKQPRSSRAEDVANMMMRSVVPVIQEMLEFISSKLSDLVPS